MITNKEYFENPNFKYEDIQEKLENVINEGIEKKGEAKIELKTDFESGRVMVWKECECGKRLNIGFATINLHYLKDLVSRCKESGLSYYIGKDSASMCRATYIIIYVKVE